MRKEDGEKISLVVRQLFAEGHKSGNKGYPWSDMPKDADPDEFEKKKLYRDHHRAIANDIVGDRPEGMYNIAKWVLNMPTGETGGNCIEMAALADYLAIKEVHIPRWLCYWCSLMPPGDHCFAMVAESPIMDTRMLAFASVEGFTKAPWAKTWLVIDPWLNTVCTANHYLEEGGSRLEKWAADGKRVAWHHGSEGPGWYPPGGSKSEYKAAFGIAPVHIHPF